jgi:hypothetical protein
MLTHPARKISKKGDVNMATNNVKYNCGCGYSTSDVEEAKRHSNEKKHTLFAYGEIKKDEKGVKYNICAKN